jgi:co-chaperonin GroES (HSP10)
MGSVAQKTIKPAGVLTALEMAFPAIEFAHQPCGEFVIVQLRSARRFSASGLDLSAAKQTEEDNTQVALVAAIGPGCFKNRSTGELWPEGPWYKVGDYVRCPKYGGDRITAKVKYHLPERMVGVQMRDAEEVEDDVVFAVFKDRDIHAVVTGDPLQVKAYL